MISNKVLQLKTKSTRTYKYKIASRNKIDKAFTRIQLCQRLYFNYALKYLYQHYGASKLDMHFPKTVTQKNFLVRECINFARKQCLKHDFSLKDLDYNIQSIEKMLMSLLTNFDEYRKKQYRIKFWSAKNIKKYLSEHDCNLTGYGRINYKHNDNEIASVTFKNQIHRDKAGNIKNPGIYVNNNYNIKLPYIGFVQVNQSLTAFKHKRIMEATIVQRKNGDYELQLKYKFDRQKSLKDHHLSNTIGLDVNLADNKLYAFSDGRIDGLPQVLLKHVSDLDWTSRECQHYLDEHNNGRDNSVKTKMYKHRQAKLKAKISNLLTNFQWQLANVYAEHYKLLAMEDLHTFNMRVSKRMNDKYKRKKINHKLALVRPTKFKQQMINAYENHGSLLLVVNSFDTSKQCSICRYIFKDLMVGQKHWTCPHCHIEHDRDHNATINIANFALNPETHPILKDKNHSYLTADNLVTIY